jgi:hypothetical protein
MPYPGPVDADDDNPDEAEDLGALGVSVKEAGDEEDVEKALEEEIIVPLAAVSEEEEPLDELARLDMLEKELIEPPLEIEDEEE